MGPFQRLRVWLFGSRSARPVTTRSTATALIDQIAHGGARSLPDSQLMQLVDLLVTQPGLRRGLRGNTRFLENVRAQFVKKQVISARQRQGLLNVIEKAYPHNLAAELRYL